MTRDPYASLKQGLVGCWIPSVSGSGLLLPDLSGRGNNGSLINTSDTVWASTIGGRAIQFDGVNDYVETSQNVGLTQQATVCCWLMLKSVTSAGILAELTTNYNNANGLILTQDTFGFTVYLSNPGQYNGTEYTVSIETDKPTHVCAIYDRSLGAAASATRLFLNGRSLTGTQGLSFTITGNFAAAKMFFGARSGGVAPSNSAMLDCRVYNRILTEPEIKLLASDRGIGFKPNKKLSRFSTRYTYQPPKAKVFEGVRVRDHDYSSLRNGLVGAWCPSLPNGGSGNTLPDVSGYGNHGVLTGMSQDRWASQSNGRGLEFALSTTEKVAITNDSPVISGFASGDFYASCHFVKSTTNGGALIAKYRDTSPINGWSLSLNSTSVFAEVINPTAFYNGITVSRNLCDGALHHVLMQRQGALVTLWIDGVQAGSLNYSANSLANATPELWIGNYSTGLNIPLGGVIYDSRIGNRALTESEIRLLASRRGIGLQPSPTRFIAREKKTGLRRRILTGQT